MPKVRYEAARGVVITPGAGIEVETFAEKTCAGDAATSNGTAGRIALAAQTIGSGGRGSVQTITDNRVSASSVVLIEVAVDGEGTRAPKATVHSIADNTFTFTLGNAEGTGNVLAANYKISYLVI
jgi:hypothetical protein